MRPLITNIQRMCVHDGPGIRTTVFFKGCSLRCPWCANPENLNPQKEFFFIREKCNDNCIRKKQCPALKGEPLHNCDIENCFYGAIGYFGKYYSPKELYEELIKDKNFYGTDGGITFSGGEALLYLPLYEDMINLLHDQNINLCLETALHVPTEHILWATKKLDYYYIDIKSVNQSVLENMLGGNIKLFIKNLKVISERIPKERIIYRIPLVPCVTDTEINLLGIEEIMAKYPPHKAEIFSVHNLGIKKYERLGIQYSNFDRVCNARLQDIQNRFKKIGIETSINYL